MRRRSFTLGIGAAALALAASRSAHAAETVRVTASLGRGNAKVGEGVFFQVEVEIEGRHGPVSDPIFPELDGVEIIERGTSSGTSISIMGGRRNASRTTTHTYVLVPSKSGRFPLNVKVQVGNKEYRAASAPILTVTGVSQVAPVDDRTPGMKRPPKPDGEIFLWPTVDRDDVYVGEQINYSFEVWERTDGEVTMRDMPTFKDFWSEELPAGKVRRDSVAGVGYRVHPSLRRALFPQRAGILTIGGGRVHVRYGRPFGLFGQPGRAKSSAKVDGPTLEVKVKALPAKGQPGGFPANNVGRFSISAEVDRTEVPLGEALTLTVEVEGDGNVRLAQPAEWPELVGMRRYDPQQEDPTIELVDGRIRGKKRYEFLIIAETPGRLEIPAHEIHYFDPDSGEYGTAKSDPITVSVASADGTQPSDAPGTEDFGARPESSGDEAADPLTEVFALPQLPRTERTQSFLRHDRWRVGAGAVPVLLALGWVGDRVLRKFGPDQAERQRAERSEARREKFELAEAAVEGGEGFYSALGALLHEVAVQRAGPDGQGLPREQLLSLLAREGVEDDELETLRTLLDACDAARFGAGDGDAASRREMLDRCRRLVDTKGWQVQ